MLNVIITILLLIQLFYPIQTQSQSVAINDEIKEQIFESEIQSKNPGFPVRLRIPKININSAVEHVGITSAGQMGVPTNVTNVGWFYLGTRPGEIGSAVIAGHFNGRFGEVGVFANLYKLVSGDKIYIESDKGNSTTFIVRESRIYDLGYADDVFIKTDHSVLNLITCDGVWDDIKKSYSKRLVVFTDKQTIDE